MAEQDNNSLLKLFGFELRRAAASQSDEEKKKKLQSIVAPTDRQTDRPTNRQTE